MQTTDLNPLAQWLCHERKKHGGVRQHLADKLGINSTTLREYEIGRYAPCLLYTSPSPRDTR